MSDFAIRIFDAGTMNFVERCVVKNVVIADVVQQRNVITRCIDHIGDASRKFFGIIEDENNTIAGYVSFVVSPGDKHIHFAAVSSRETVNLEHFYDKEVRLYNNGYSIYTKFDQPQWRHWIEGFHRPEMKIIYGANSYSIEPIEVVGDPKVTVIDSSY